MGLANQGRGTAVNQFKSLWDWFQTLPGYKATGAQGARSGGQSTRFGQGYQNAQFLKPQSFKDFSKEYAGPDTSFSPKQNYQSPGGWSGAEKWQGQGYNDPYKDYELDPSVDPTEVINSALPRLQEQIDRGFANAGARFGAAGGGFAGTPYAATLGGVQRKASSDLNELTQNTLYDAAKFKAQLKAQMDQGEADRGLAAWGQQQGNELSAWGQQQGNDLAAWGKQGDWDTQGQLANMNRELQAWAQSGDWRQQDWQQLLGQYSQDKDRWWNEYNTQRAQSQQGQDGGGGQDPTSAIMSILGLQTQWDQNALAQGNYEQELADKRLMALNSFGAANYGNLDPQSAMSRALAALKSSWSQLGGSSNYNMYDTLLSLMGRKY